MKRVLKFRDLEKNYITLEVEIKKEHKNKRTIDLEDVEEYNVLSISGDLKEFTGGRPSFSSCGQILDSIKTKAGPKFKLIKIWEKWHLNDMRSGTRRQNVCLYDWKDRPEGYSYKEDCEHLKKYGLYIDRGYKYGSAWLVETLPNEIIKEIDSLCNYIK